MGSLFKSFVSRLYLPKSSDVNVNDLIYPLFCAKKDDIENHQLLQCTNEAYSMYIQLDCDMRTMLGAWHKDSNSSWQKLEFGMGRWYWTADYTLDGRSDGTKAVLDLLACSDPKRCDLPKCFCLINRIRRIDLSSVQQMMNWIIIINTYDL